MTDDFSSVERLLRPKVEQLFQKFPAIFLTGPRQSGKTTLAKAAFPHLPYINLEDPFLRASIQEDPHGFLKSYEQGVIIDEAQHIPELFSYIQLYIDERNRPGQYLLTGSQNFLLNARISQSLADRVGGLHLLPLSWAEMTACSTEIKPEIALFNGGYPRLYAQNIEPADFFPSYLQTYIERDVRQLKNVTSLSKFQKFLLLCAGRVGQILNLSSLANDCGLSVSTMQGWISVLEASYILYLLPAFSLNINKQIVKSPKIFFHDTGLLCNLLGIKSVTELRTHFAYGSLFENFVLNEFLKGQYNRGERKNLFFLRDQRGHEVNVLILSSQGAHLYEIKASATFNRDFVKNLLYYKDLMPVVDGTVIYNGDQEIDYKNFHIRSFGSLFSSKRCPPDEAPSSMP